MKDWRRSGRLCSISMFVLATMVVGCKKEEVQPRQVVRPVKLFEFGSAVNKPKFSFPGRVHANQTVELGFEVTGKIAELAVVRGQEVEKGDLLARLDDRDFQNAVAAAQAVVDEAQAFHDRIKVAAEKNAVSLQQLDEALAALRVAEAELAVRQKALQDTEMRADFDGIVANRYVENFQNIIAKEPILSLQDISKLEIRVNVPESDVFQKESDTEQLQALFSVAPGESFSLTLKEIATEADPVAQTFLVTLLMDRPEGYGLFPGMTATVEWFLGVESAIATHVIPSACVTGVPGEATWVWVVDSSAMTVSRRNVEIGRTVGGEMVEVRSGLSPGDVVAAAGVRFLAEGTQVRKYEAIASLDDSPQ